MGRAEPEWAALNKVDGMTGKDNIAVSNEQSEAPLKYDPVRAGLCPADGVQMPCAIC